MNIPLFETNHSFLSIQGCCFTFLVFVWSNSTTLRILTIHSYSTSYTACRKSAPANVSPDVTFVCPHSTHKHVMRSLVTTLVSMPMPLFAGPVCHVTRSGSECLMQPDPRIQASLSLVILQSGSVKPMRKLGRYHRLFPPVARCADAVKATCTKAGCHAGHS